MATILNRREPEAANGRPPLPTSDSQDLSPSKLRAVFRDRIVGACAAMIARLPIKACKLNQEQLCLLERRHLAAFANGVTIWLIIMLFIGSIIDLKGEKNITPYNIPLIEIKFSSDVWLSGLVLIGIIDFMFLFYTNRMQVKFSDRAIMWLQGLWCVLATFIAFYWFSGNWTLLHLLKPGPFLITQQTFIYITVPSQAITILLLSPNRKGMLSALLVGFLFPLLFYSYELFSDPDRPYRLHTALIWNGTQICAYCILGLVLANDFRRSRSRELLLETERNRAESERRRGDLFIAAISHDLRQPLAALSLKLDTLRAKIKSPETVVELSLKDLQKLKQQTDAIEFMVSGTLDLSSLHAGTWKVNPREVALPVLMKKIGADLHPEAAEKGIELDIQSIPYLVKTDPLALERILRNLIGNALRYTPATSDSRQGLIVVEAKLFNDFVRVSVADNGIGIPDDRLKDIFAEYVQLENRERDRNKGLGLGLSIVQGLANLLGHNLDVKSQLGKGTTFFIDIPVLGKIPPELLTQTAPIEASENFEGMVVLMVEDDEGPRESLRERLMDWGCYVLDGASAQDVIDELRDEIRLGTLPAEPSLIFSDYRLKDGKTGIEAIDTIRKETKLDLPAAIWTAETAAGSLKEIADSGLPRLAKPPGDAALTSILAKAAKAKIATQNVQKLSLAQNT